MADPISSRLIGEAARLVRLEYAADESEWAGTARQLDRHHEMHTDAGVRLRDIADEVRALEAAHAMSTDMQHCGHPAAAIAHAAEGTAYCAWCADVARAQADRDDADTLDTAWRRGAAAASYEIGPPTPPREECPYPEDDTRRRWWLRGYSYEARLHRAMVAEIEHDEARANLTVLAFSVRDALARGTTPAVRIARRDLADAVAAVVVERDEALADAERLRQAIHVHVAMSNAVHTQVVRERDEARRVALIDAIAVLNDAGDDDTKGDEWLGGFAAAITVLRQLVENPDRDEVADDRPPHGNRNGHKAEE